ncbi:MAG: hypothetical protein OXH98_02265 [Caldilineaceae bacterium]|nr:hypothetical protein [Caldilineaceae bacterium]
MLRTLLVTPSPSIVVVQGAYSSLVASDGCSETEYYSATDTFDLFCGNQVILVDQHLVSWLEFQRLTEEWKEQRGAASSISEAALCPAYQSIIGMGEQVVPFILRQLEVEGDDPDQWFWALGAVTRAQPVEDADRGNYARMARAWLEWGEREGYVW